MRGIPGSRRHIAAFMPVRARSPAGAAFSSVWPDSFTVADLFDAEERFRNGLCVSGLSMAGLAGLMLTPFRRREEDAGERPDTALQDGAAG